MRSAGYSLLAVSVLLGLFHFGHLGGGGGGAVSAAAYRAAQGVGRPGEAQEIAKVCRRTAADVEAGKIKDRVAILHAFLDGADQVLGDSRPAWNKALWELTTAFNAHAPIDGGNGKAAETLLQLAHGLEQAQ